MSYSTSDYLNQLQSDRRTLVENLTKKKIKGLSGNETFTELVPKVLDISNVSEPIKNVNFYDYDGTLLYSYTTEKFLSMENFPNNPIHNGLISQGWNWDFEDAQRYASKYNFLNIGQMYITDNGATRIYIYLEKGRLTPWLTLAVNGTTDIDWGDGSPIETITGTSTAEYKNIRHYYSQPGEYVISIFSNNNTYIRGTSNVGSQVIWGYANGGNNLNRAYQNSIRKIEIGENIYIGNYAFSVCNSMSTITIPKDCSVGEHAFATCASLKTIIIPSNKSTTMLGSSIFAGCTSLKNVILSNHVSSIGPYAFSQCYALDNISIPDSVKYIQYYAFSMCRSMSRIVIPSELTYIDTCAFQEMNSVAYVLVTTNKLQLTIGQLAFQGLLSVAYYDFTECTIIPKLYDNQAIRVNTDTKIIVPDELYDEWIADANWSKYASYIIKKSDFNN